MCRLLLAVAFVLSLTSCSSLPARHAHSTAPIAEPAVDIAGMPAPGFDAPVLLRAPRPHYPLAAQLSGDSGTVELRALVGTDGKLSHIQVSGASTLLVQAVRASAPAVVFEPARLGGIPVEVWVTIPVIFTAPGPSSPALTAGNTTHLVEHLMPAPARETPYRPLGDTDKQPRR
jgi:TonB family protein